MYRVLGKSFYKKENMKYNKLILIILFFFLLNQSKAQIFNSLFEMDTVVELQENSELMQLRKGNTVSFSSKDLLFTDCSQKLADIDTLELLKVDLFSMLRSKIKLVFDSKLKKMINTHMAISAIAHNKEFVILSGYNNTLIFNRKDADQYVLINVLKDGFDKIKIVNDSIVVCFRFNNPEHKYMVYDFAKNKVVEKKPLLFDIDEMMHISPSIYADAYGENIYFLQAGQYRIIQYNWATQKQDTIIGKMDGWDSFTKSQLNEICNSQPGSPAISVLNKYLPNVDVPTAINVVNDTMIFVWRYRHYMGSDMSLLVEVLTKVDGVWRFLCQGYKGNQSCGEGVVTKSNYPLVCYQRDYSPLYSFDRKFGLIVSNQKDSPLGKTWNQYLDESQVKLVDENPVFKMCIFTFKGVQ